MRFSPSTMGWYPEFIKYNDLPKDCITVSQEVYESLLGQRVMAHPKTGQPIPYVAPTPPIRKMLKERTSALRWEKETGGVELPNGVRVETNIESQNRISSVLTQAGAAGITEVSFKALSGWITLSLEELEVISGVIARHVQACFNTERMHHEFIDSATLKDLKDYDVTIGWPGASLPTE